ncbi:MAG: hypothetical protein HUK05_01910, partial [Prevotella sp.]|nr:hypothetical protein [Prevotella sp.]
MKKIIFSIIAALTLASCGTTKKTESGSTTAINTPNQGVQTLTSASLLQKIKDNAVT